MEKFVRLEGLVAPLDRNNVDTDAIIPKQFLKSIKRSGFGPNAFDEWRYMDVGQPGQDCTDRPKNPNFVLNQPRYQGAQVLLTRANFGCGSSREHAPWALLDFGFKAAGFEWREPGCSMCLAMNADRLEPGERCASTSNRNFEGRQGAGGRTHLLSPAMAAAAAIAGHFADVRDVL